MKTKSIFFIMILNSFILLCLSSCEESEKIIHLTKEINNVQERVKGYEKELKYQQEQIKELVKVNNELVESKKNQNSFFKNVIIFIFIIIFLYFVCKLLINLNRYER